MIFREPGSQNEVAQIRGVFVYPNALNQNVSENSAAEGGREENFGGLSDSSTLIRVFLAAGDRIFARSNRIFVLHI